MDCAVSVAVGEEEKWDMPLPDLYRLAVTFYKEKSGKIL